MGMFDCNSQICKLREVGLRTLLLLLPEFQALLSDLGAQSFVTR